MDNDLQKKYEDGGRTICPYCGSIDLDWGRLEVDSDQAYQSVQCLDCGKRWNDVYEYSFMEPY